MSAQKIEDTGGSIRLTDSDLIEVADESAAPDEVTNKQRVAEMLPFASPDAPTTQARPWEVEPPQASPETAEQVEEEEVTNVLARQAKERDWVDTHAVVDEEGRLRLSEEIARKLQPGAIVEVRVAAWAVDPSENS